MGRAIVVGFVLFASGCDALLRLQDVHDLPKVDAAPDSAPDDAPASLCGKPPLFQTNAKVYMMTGLTESALEDQEPAFAVLADGSNLYLYNYMGAPAALPVTGSHPAMTRDSSALFFASSSTTQVAFRASGFVASTPVPTLANVRPGAAVSIGGTLHMVGYVYATMEFVELTAPDPMGPWSQFGTTLQAATLGATGALTYPSLSADGLILTFVTGPGVNTPGVYYARRDDAGRDFSNYTSHGLLLPITRATSSPWLSADCTTLYVTDEPNGTLLRYTR